MRTGLSSLKMAVQLQDWQPGDWNEERDFDPNLDIFRKKSFFESALAFNTSVFESINPATGQEYVEAYGLRNEEIAFPDDTSPGVPGPFSYDLGWNKWEVMSSMVLGSCIVTLSWLTLDILTSSLYKRK